MFSSLPKTSFSFSVTFIFLSEIVFNLDQSKNLSFGKEGKILNYLPVFFQGMKLSGKTHGNLSDDEDGVQSGSATGFSDGEEIAHARPARVISHAFDPVNRILDKIDAELSSLTHSQGVWASF